MGLLNKVLSIGKRQPEQYILIEDRKAQNTNGGTFTTGAWQQRDLNTVVQDDTGQALVSGNVAYLPPGKYRVRGLAPGVGVQSHQCRLLDNETGHALLTGTVSFAMNDPGASVPPSQSESFIAGTFVLRTNSQIRIEHQCSNTGTTTGFGKAGNLGEEIYTRMELFRTTL